MSSHFEEKNPLEHVVEKRVEGLITLSESHGTETPGHFSAAADSMRETAVVAFLIWLLLTAMATPPPTTLLVLIAFGTGWFAWKTGRSGWLGWARLERLHRLIEQERYEIEHHRSQEREELVALYSAKGFSGKLLDEVVDVLMADQDRLLKVMLEEEMGLTLQAYEHPLKQCLGAAVGTASALIVLGFFLFLLPLYGMLIASPLILTTGAVVSAVYEKNRIIPAIVWNLSLGVLASGSTFFIFQLFSS